MVVVKVKWVVLRRAAPASARAASGPMVWRQKPLAVRQTDAPACSQGHPDLATQL